MDTFGKLFLPLVKYEVSCSVYAMYCLYIMCINWQIAKYVIFMGLSPADCLNDPIENKARNCVLYCQILSSLSILQENHRTVQLKEQKKIHLRQTYTV